MDRSIRERILHVTRAGLARNFREAQGYSSHYYQWIGWESLSKEHGISAAEADNAWKAFLERHGDSYPGGQWQQRETEFLENGAAI